MSNNEAFEGKNLSDLLKDIHDNVLSKRIDIKSIISQLTSMVTTPDDAVVIVPLIKDFMDVSIKNDEQVVKVATIAQRIVTANTYASGGDNTLLTEAEKEQLLRNAMEVDEELDSIRNKLEIVDEKAA